MAKVYLQPADTTYNVANSNEDVRLQPGFGDDSVAFTLFAGVTGTQVNPVLAARSTFNIPESADYQFVANADSGFLEVQDAGGNVILSLPLSTNDAGQLESPVIRNGNGEPSRVLVDADTLEVDSDSVPSNVLPPVEAAPATESEQVYSKSFYLDLSGETFDATTDETITLSNFAPEQANPKFSVSPGDQSNQLVALPDLNEFAGSLTVEAMTLASNASGINDVLDLSATASDVAGLANTIHSIEAAQNGGDSYFDITLNFAAADGSQAGSLTLANLTRDTAGNLDPIVEAGGSINNDNTDYNGTAGSDIVAGLVDVLVSEGSVSLDGSAAQGERADAGAEQDLTAADGAYEAYSASFDLADMQEVLWEEYTFRLTVTRDTSDQGGEADAPVALFAVSGATSAEDVVAQLAATTVGDGAAPADGWEDIFSLSADGSVIAVDGPAELSNPVHITSAPEFNVSLVGVESGTGAETVLDVA